MNDLILRVQCIYESIFTSLFHIVYTSDKKTEFFEDKTMKKHDLITYGYHWSKEKRRTNLWTSFSFGFGRSAWKVLVFYLIKSMKFHRSLMIQLHDAMLSIHSSWAAVAWCKTHQSADLPKPKSSPQDESLLMASAPPLHHWPGQTFLNAAGWQEASRYCSASTRKVPTPAQARGR